MDPKLFEIFRELSDDAKEILYGKCKDRAETLKSAIGDGAIIVKIIPKEGVGGLKPRRFKDHPCEIRWGFHDVVLYQGNIWDPSLGAVVCYEDYYRIAFYEPDRNQVDFLELWY